MANELGVCTICGCTTGGAAFCYAHAPYMVYPQADGSFIVDRNGRKRVWRDDLPPLVGRDTPPEPSDAAHLRNVVKSLLDKLDVIVPMVDGMIALQRAQSGYQYSGPYIALEMAELREILKSEVALAAGPAAGAAADPPKPLGPYDHDCGCPEVGYGRRRGSVLTCRCSPIADAADPHGAAPENS